MKKMIKRADGSVSQHGFLDNVRKKAAENKRKGVKGKVTNPLKKSAEASTSPPTAKNGISCWKGYKKKGMKMLKGKMVNNCVKKK